MAEADTTWAEGDPVCLGEEAAVLGRMRAADGGVFEILTPHGSTLKAGFVWLRKPTPAELAALEKLESEADADVVHAPHAPRRVDYRELRRVHQQRQRGVVAVAKPAAILLVARPGEGMALVAAGQSGARPPQVWQCGCGSWAHDANNVNLPLSCARLLSQSPPPSVALPLWLGGALVPEGVDRVRRVIAAQGWSARDALPSTAWCMEPTFDGALLLAREAEARSLCTLVLLDDDGRELR